MTDELLVRIDGGRSDATARIVAAVLTLPCAAAVFLDDPGPLRVTLGLAGLAVGVGWLASSRRALAATTPPDVLRLTGDALVLESGGTSRTVPYADVVDLDLCDQAADLVLVLRDGGRVGLAPGFDGLDAPALADRLRPRLPHGISR